MVIYIFLTIPHDNTQCWLFHKFMLSNFKLGLAVFDPGPCNLERLLDIDIDIETLFNVEYV